MLKRKIADELKKWQKNHKNTCLLIMGARQVGKTYAIKAFGESNYENVIYIDFIKHEEYKSAFEDNLDFKNILKQLTLINSELKIISGKTLLVLDEIQVCERAITALKYIAQDPDIDCIASGSLLGIAYKRVSSFPVGYIERLEMHSLDFEEFCWALNVNLDVLKEYYNKMEQIPIFVHNQMLEIFKEYIVVGGMPKVVNDFKINHHFGNVLKIQRNILNDYKDDIIKYAEVSEKAKIRECFDSIPIQLAKENKKFKYSIVDKQGNSKKYSGALEWLYDAGIINFCYNLTVPSTPLEGYTKKDTFKIYMRDTGLLVAMLENGSQKEIIDGNLGIYKGAIYENIIADIFTKHGRKLYYFEHNSTLEIDFFIRYHNIITAVEVKSADNTKSKSLNTVLSKWEVPQGLKLSKKNIDFSKETNTYIFPLYMAYFLNEIDKGEN